MTDLYSVAGKTALVTGGSRGIGYMIAEGLLRGGARVMITSRKADACHDAVDALSPLGDVVAHPADVGDPEQMGGLVEALEAWTDRLDVLVNNAGATWGAPFAEFPASAWDKVMGVNVKAPFMLTQQLHPLLTAHATAEDPSRVINVGSIDGIMVPEFPNYSYGASKAAVHHLTKHLARELSPNVLVNAIAPGPFATKMMEAALEERGDEIREMSPLKRIGTPEDAAGLAIFLSSRASSYITGAVIPLDGGLSTTAQIS